MVKQQKKYSRKKRFSKGFKANSAKARRINASTEYDTCTTQLSPFGGLLAMIKFLDLFAQIQKYFRFHLSGAFANQRLAII